MLTKDERAFAVHCFKHTSDTVKDIVLAMMFARASEIGRFGGPMTLAEARGFFQQLTTDVEQLKQELG